MSVTRSSEPAVQHREGPDLDALVEQIAAEHPAPVRFLDVDRVRRGGVMGFFAKEQYALSYQVAAEPERDDVTLAPPAAGRHGAGAMQPVDLDALLGSADSRDVAPSLPTPAAGSHAAGPATPSGPADERFADLLLRLATEHDPERDAERHPGDPEVGHAAGRHHIEPPTFEPLHSAPVSRHRATDETVAPTPVVEPPQAPVDAPAVTVVAGTVTPELVAPEVVTPDSVAPSAFEPAAVAPTPAGLAALGVPSGWNTAATDSARAAEIVAAVLALPPAPSAPTAAGAVVVLLSDVHGPADDCLRHLTALAPGGTHTATDRDSAVRAVADLRAAGTPGVLVARPGRASALLTTIAALQPDLTVLEVEATGKTGDHRRRLDAAAAAGLRVDALAVVRATDTTSPATVWELGVPILSVDGRASEVGVWAGLLLAADRD